MRAYCVAVGVEYQDSIVNWGPITEEQKKIWEFELNFPPLLHLVGKFMKNLDLLLSTNNCKKFCSFVIWSHLHLASHG